MRAVRRCDCSVSRQAPRPGPKDDPDWQVLAAWVNGATLAAAPDSRVARVIQTNAAGDNIHLIDPATNKVVGVIHDIEVPHGVTSAPDGTRMYFTNESLHTLDVVDAAALAVTARIPGRKDPVRDEQGVQPALRLLAA